MRLHFALVTFLLSFVMTGCIQLKILVKVNKDGSGTLTEKVLFDSQLLEDLLKSLPQGAKQRPWDIDPKELKARASDRGKGVVYTSSKPITKGKWRGFEAVYTFADINTLSVDPDPGKRAPQQPGEKKKEGDPMRFAFKKGKTAKLSVLLPRDEGKKGEQKPKKLDPRDESFQMMRGMLKDMSVDIGVEVDGKVVRSNASHRKGNRVTMMALDFNKLIEDDENLAKVLNAETFQDSAKAFNQVKGMQIETKKKISVSFR